jgi:hypothetical protein
LYVFFLFSFGFEIHCGYQSLLIMSSLTSVMFFFLLPNAGVFLKFRLSLLPDRLPIVKKPQLLELRDMHALRLPALRLVLVPIGAGIC